MNADTIHTITAACLLIVSGMASFPYSLDYGNTSWLPRKTRPDRAYLERPYEYDYPAYAICQVLFWRKDYGDGFCYAGRIMSFSYGKVYAVLLTAAAAFVLHLTGALALPAYRGVSMAFCLLGCLFLIHDYIRVFRLRGDNEYSDPIGIKEMYPESLNLLQGRRT